ASLHSLGIRFASTYGWSCPAEEWISWTVRGNVNIGTERLTFRSIAMNYPTSESEIVAKIMDEHDQLREKVKRIHAIFSESEPSAAEIQAVLREFLTALTVHFSNEED